MAKKKIADNAGRYAKKAREEAAQLDILLKSGAFVLCVSRCYYAAFYSMRSVLENIGIKTSSHKQTQVEFRKHFIKTDIIDKKYSKILTELFETRSKADYDIFWATSKPFAVRLVNDTKEFVETVLASI